jgi:5-hydroxyisourate hydrolase
MGRMTTHVLDTAQGRPAGGVRVSVTRIDGTVRQLVASGETNADGRCERPLLEGAAFVPGIYELQFAVAAYFVRCGLALPEPPFLGDVVLRVGIADGGGHYHVPLLVSPWSYSTYRGS